MRPRSLRTTASQTSACAPTSVSASALERELAGALGVVVAVGAVLVDDVFGRGRALFDARLASGRGEGEGDDGEGAHNP